MRYLISLLISLLLVTPCLADRIFIILPMQGGSPSVGELKYHGHVLIEQYKTTGLYMVTGKTAELDALAKMANAQAITKITDVTATTAVAVEPKPTEEVITKGDPIVAKETPVQWAELSTKPVKETTDKLNTLLTAEATSTVKPVVAETMTYREVITKMVSNPKWETGYWIKDE